ncbi:MAG: hypothetical protein OXC37_02275 [Bdellovibrionaceae bacterium]|nr:hypothetical protein [Pseudobdellovibrionaceae bacterium]
MKIERKQLKEIEFIFKQSIQGFHLLFDDNKKLSRILSKPTQEKTFFDSKKMDKIQEIFTNLISKKSIKEKQNYLNNLTAENFEILVRTYFHILDNTLSIKNQTVH